MLTTASHRRLSPLVFVAIVAAVYTTALALAGRLSSMEGAGALATGMTLDMVVVVPLAFYFLVVRRWGLPLGSLLPVLILSAVGASLVLPAEHQGSLHVLEAVLGIVELGLVGWIVWRTVRAVREARHYTSADPLEQFHIAALRLLGNDRMAGMVASEIGVFYYSLGSWRSRPHIPKGAVAVTHHERSGQGGIVLGLLFVVMAEGLAVHFLLASWSSIAAWIFTATTAYGGLWLIADYRATVLRPILITDEHIVFRAGLRWGATVPREIVAGITHDKPEGGKKTNLSLTLMGSPTHWFELTEPVWAQGPYGMRRQVRAIGCEPDAPQELEQIA